MVDRYPVTKEHRAAQEIVFESLFERVIEGLEAGITPSETLRLDPRGVDRGRFFSWMRRDSEREKRFDKAKEVGTLVMEDMMMERINSDSLEDVQRTKLAIDTLKWLMQVNNRKRYRVEKEAPNSFADGGVTIVIGDVQTGRVIEHDHNKVIDGNT